jgi:hypothetical protein
METGFDSRIIEHIRRRLSNGVGESEIMEELTHSADPMFARLSGDVGNAASYLAQAKIPSRRQ